MYKIIILVIILSRVPSVVSTKPDSDGHPVLYVFIPIIVLVVLITFFWFWWECQRAGQTESTDYDPYFDIGSKVSRNIETSAVEPPMARGRLVRQVIVEERSPNGRGSSERLPYMNHDLSPSSPDSVSSSFTLSPPTHIHEQRSVSASFFPREHFTGSLSPSMEINDNIWNANPRWTRPRNIRDSANGPLGTHDGIIELVPTDQKESKKSSKNKYVMSDSVFDGRNTPKSDVYEGNTSKRWMKRRNNNSSKKNIASGSRKPSAVRKLFPRIRRKKSIAFPTSRELQMEIALNERESYENIKALGAQLEETFIDYYTHQSDADVTSVTVSSHAPLKSCMKCRSMRRRKSKHVRFQIKSSLFRAKKRKKSTQEQKQIKAVALVHEYPDSSVRNWVLSKETKHKADYKKRKRNSIPDGNLSEKADARRGMVGRPYRPQSQHSNSVSLAVMDKGDGDGYGAVKRTGLGKTSIGDSRDIDGGYSLGSYYSFQGDLYYSGHQVDVELNDFGSRFD